MEIAGVRAPFVEPINFSTLLPKYTVLYQQFIQPVHKNFKIMNIGSINMCACNFKFPSNLINLLSRILIIIFAPCIHILSTMTWFLNQLMFTIHLSTLSKKQRKL